MLSFLYEYMSFHSVLFHTDVNKVSICLLIFVSFVGWLCFALFDMLMFYIYTGIFIDVGSRMTYFLHYQYVLPTDKQDHSLTDTTFYKVLHHNHFFILSRSGSHLCTAKT